MPVEGFGLARSRLDALMQRATAWSRVKRGPSVDEHFIRLMPWMTVSSDAAAVQDAFQRLTDGVAYRKAFGRAPLLTDSPFGATFRTTRQSGTSDAVAHVDAVIAALAEAGFPLNLPVRTELRAYRLFDVLNDSLLRSDREREPHWSLVAYCAYLGAQGEWTNAHGELCSVDEILQRINAEPPGAGPCSGTHRLWATAVAFRRAEIAPHPFRESSLAASYRRLADARAICLRTQFSDGCWDRRWFAEDNTSDHTADETDLQRRLDRLSVTSHLLEAFAILPDDLRPDAASLVSALQYVLSELEVSPDLFLEKDFTGTTHAVRALCLYASAP